MSLECITSAKLDETGFGYTLSLISGKYKIHSHTSALVITPFN